MNIPKFLQFISIYFLCFRSGNCHLSVARVISKFSGHFSNLQVSHLSLRSVIILSFEGVYLNFKSTGKYLAVSRFLECVHMEDTDRKRKNPERKGEKEKLIMFKGIYVWREVIPMSLGCQFIQLSYPTIYTIPNGSTLMVTYS